MIGSPGSESNEQFGTDTRPWLSEAALEGGTARGNCAIAGPNYCHFDMTEDPDFSAALAAGLSEISERVADGCTFEQPFPSADIDLNQVVIQWSDGSAELIVRDDADRCREGWALNSLGQIALCPGTCARLNLDPDAETLVGLSCDRP